MSFSRPMVQPRNGISVSRKISGVEDKKQRYTMRYIISQKMKPSKKIIIWTNRIIRL